MELKRMNVVMLPTEEGIIVKTNIEPNGKGHLYFIIEDKVKDGDWFYHSWYSEVRKFNSKVHGSANKNNIGRKVIASTDKSLNLPQPSKAFIEKYCKLGGIDEVDVEYIDRYNIEYKYIPGFGETAKRIDLPNELKINDYNEITIHPIKSSWSKGDKDLEEAFVNFAGDVFDENYGKDTSFNDRAKLMVKEWINKNL